LHTPAHSDNKRLQIIQDWHVIGYSQQHKLELKNARWDPTPERRLPATWPTNRLNNVAIATAPAYNAVVLYDEEGTLILLDNTNLGHVNFKQFFQPEGEVNETSQKSLKPSDNVGEWDVSVGFTECATRLLVLKRNV
jgi:hypothetical protein